MEQVKKRILITGGSGYIGTALIPALGEADITIVDKVPSIYSHVGYIKQEFYSQLIWKPELVEEIKRADIIIHLLATFSKDKNISRYINYITTSMLFAMCRGSRKERFIFTSTCGVKYPEDKSVYTLWKNCAERYIQQFRDLHAPWIILRLASVFGNSKRMSYEPLVNNLVRSAEDLGKMEIFGSNENRPFVHIGTVVKAISRLVKMPIESIAFQEHELATVNCTKQDVADIILKYLPNTKVTANASANKGYVIGKNTTLAKLNITNYKSLEDGIKEMIVAPFL